MIFLQTKFGARCRAWNMAPYNSEATPCIAIRFEEEMTLPDNLGPILDRNEILRLEVKDNSSFCSII